MRNFEDENDFNSTMHEFSIISYLTKLSEKSLSPETNDERNWILFLFFFSTLFDMMKRTFKDIKYLKTIQLSATRENVKENPSSHLNLIMMSEKTLRIRFLKQITWGSGLLKFWKKCLYQTNWRKIIRISDSVWSLFYLIIKYTCNYS